MTLYEYLYEEAFRRNETVEEFANKMGLSKATVFRIQHRAPSRATYHKISEYLDQDVMELKHMPIHKKS